MLGILSTVRKNVKKITKFCFVLFLEKLIFLNPLFRKLLICNLSINIVNQNLSCFDTICQLAEVTDVGRKSSLVVKGGLVTPELHVVSVHLAVVTSAVFSLLTVKHLCSEALL